MKMLVRIAGVLRASHFLLFLAIFNIAGFTTDNINIVHGDSKVPCFFIFGDSLSDPGNNNDLVTTAKANYQPYGVDFIPGKQPGRFTNGYNYVDTLSQILGFYDLIPPFNSILTLQEILTGVNYASGSAGILFESGRIQGENVWLGQQILNHKEIASKISSLNDTTGSDYLQQCLYIMNIGNNDYLDNYYLPAYYNTSELYTPEEYATLLVDQYAIQIKNLYELGARKFAIYGLGYLGCTLGEIALYGADDSGCVDEINTASQLFNLNLLPVIDELNSNFTDSYFTFINTSALTPTTDKNFYVDAGFSVSNESCCPVRSDGMCAFNDTPCSNRSDYYFWDYFHPTERVYVITAQESYVTEDATVAYPYNISKLISL